METDRFSESEFKFHVDDAGADLGEVSMCFASFEKLLVQPSENCPSQVSAIP